MRRQVFCDYCKKPAKLVDSAEIYGGVSYGMVWACLPCNAWVGCHQNSKTHAPLGRLANAQLRKAKIAAHAAFDPIWHRLVQNGQSKSSARKDAYLWLADQLGIKPKECHIGKFDLATCREVVQVCKKSRYKPNIFESDQTSDYEEHYQIRKDKNHDNH